MRTWRTEDLHLFLQYISDDRMSPIVTLAVSTGMRRGEVLGLKWDDIDLDGARLSIRRSLTSVKRRPIFSERPKTDRGRRQIAIDARTIVLLRSVRKRQLEEKLAVGSAWEDLGLVFTEPDGQLVHPDRFANRFDRRVASSGLPRLRFHDLRHTHASLALRAGVHPKVVSERLGHASIAITLDIYSHLIPAMQSDAAETIAALVYGSNG